MLVSRLIESPSHRFSFLPGDGDGDIDCTSLLEKVDVERTAGDRVIEYLTIEGGNEAPEAISHPPQFPPTLST